MANNLKKFQTEAEYTSATLNYPAVSWVTSGDTVHFDKTAPTPVENDKVIIASYGGSGYGKFCFFNCLTPSYSVDIATLILDNVEVNPIQCESTNNLDASGLHIAKYTLTGTTIGTWINHDLGVNEVTTPAAIDVLIPSQITAINALTQNSITNLVIEATTPPSTELGGSDMPVDNIFVPDESVNAYKAASGWSDRAGVIFPISDYQGNLPV